MKTLFKLALSCVIIFLSVMAVFTWVSSGDFAGGYELSRESEVQSKAALAQIGGFATGVVLSWFALFFLPGRIRKKHVEASKSGREHVSSSPDKANPA